MLILILQESKNLSNYSEVRVVTSGIQIEQSAPLHVAANITTPNYF